MKKNLFSICILSCAVLLVACNSDNDSDHVNPSPDTPQNNIQNPVVRTQAYELTDMSQNAEQSLLMTYKMLGINNKEVQATALLFTPRTTPPVGGWPIVVWAHGTTGVADQCAPSRSSLNPAIRQMISQLLAQGYVVVAPDYEGLGEPSGQEIHPFLNLKSEAFSITDAVVATRNYLGNKVSNKWVTVGHSQGGQAALGAAQYAPRAKLDYKGTVAVAPASNLDLILVAGEQAVANRPVNVQIPVYAGLDTFTALISAGLKNSNPDLQYTQIFKNPTAQIVSDYAQSVCADQLGLKFVDSMSNYAVLNNNSLNGYGRTQDNFLSLNVVKNFTSKDSQPLTAQVTTPITIYQGARDTTVPKAATDLLVDRAKALGTKINYVTDSNWDHGSAYALNIEVIVQDVKNMLAQ